jgi:phenylalanyl-tRNA synthetase alpha chain
MLKYGIIDARSFFDTNYKWLEHYGFNVLDLNSKLEI